MEDRIAFRWSSQQGSHTETLQNISFFSSYLFSLELLVATIKMRGRLSGVVLTLEFRHHDSRLVYIFSFLNYSTSSFFFFLPFFLFFFYLYTPPRFSLFLDPTPFFYFSFYA